MYDVIVVGARCGVVEGTVSFSEFFSPQNLQRSMAAAGVGAAAIRPAD